MVTPIGIDWTQIDLRTKAALAKNMSAVEAFSFMAPAVGAWHEWDWVLLRGLLDRLESAKGGIEPKWLAPDSPWAGSVTGRWLLADEWSRTGRKAEALALWDGIVAAGGAPLAEALFSRAKLRRDVGMAAGAFEDVAAAARCSSHFAFQTKLARLLERMAQHTPPPGRRLKLALLFSSSTDLLAPILRLACFREGFFAEIYQAPYGNYRQEVLDPESGLHIFAPDIAILGTHWRDAHIPSIARDGPAEVERLWTEASGLWEVLQARHRCTILQHNFDSPAHDAGGFLSAAEAGGRRRILRAFNERLWAQRPAGVVPVDIERLEAEVGSVRWSDATQWHLAKQHPGPEAFAELTGLYVALIRARLGFTKKVLVLDLDNTLWGGVVGEDGVAGIKVGPPSATGETYACFQGYIRELKNRGILLAVCSKNNDADARSPFKEHEGMVLKEKDFVAFMADWSEKSVNVKILARKLNLNLDSFVFVDDNPVECERMRRAIPEVGIVELGSDPARYIQQLHVTGWFESLTLSAEDLQRSDIYKDDMERDRAQSEATDLDAFLNQLRMKMYHGSFNERVLDRVVQLLGKTNQFNLTSRRHDPEQVRRFMNRPGVWTQYFRLTDCYGDNGIIGVMIAVPCALDPSVWEVDTFLMSCRVIGRGVEAYMAAVLLRAAKSAGCVKVRGLFLRTTKNEQVIRLYQKLGFQPDKAWANEGSAYVYDLATQPITESSAITPAE